jgi:hypothetical protein
MFKELLNQSIQNGEPVMTLSEMKQIIEESCEIRGRDNVIPNIIQEYNEMSIELTEQMIHDKSEDDLHYGLLEELADTCMSPFFVMYLFGISQDELMRALTVKLKRYKEKMDKLKEDK